ncbi:hypothetical protein J6590_054528 [Homalodisca vitripennis]|nr:hypothetical protein J6590_054528 [Homalodisca vitripennis]
MPILRSSATGPFTLQFPSSGYRPQRTLLSGQICTYKNYARRNLDYVPSTTRWLTMYSVLHKPGQCVDPERGNSRTLEIAALICTTRPLFRLSLGTIGGGVMPVIGHTPATPPADRQTDRRLSPH